MEEPGSSPLSALESLPSTSAAPSPVPTPAPAPPPTTTAPPALALGTPAPPKPLAFPLLPAPFALPVSAPSITSSTTLAAPPATTALSPLKRRISFDRHEEGQDAFLDENSAAHKAAKDASQWNGLLKWARKARGPQWDWGSGMYHVDVGSKEYYSGVTPLASHSAVPSHLQSSYPQQQPQYASPSRDTSAGQGSGSASAGTYESGRPRRTRAAMGGRG